MPPITEPVEVSRNNHSLMLLQNATFLWKKSSAKSQSWAMTAAHDIALLGFSAAVVPGWEYSQAG